MAKYLVKDKNISAIADGTGAHPVVKGVIELPDGSLALDLLSEGVITPVKAEPVEVAEPKPPKVTTPVKKAAPKG